MILAPYIMEGRDWTAQHCPDPAGWLMSEKLRGIRAEWDGAALWTKIGAKINAPAWFTAGLPAGVRLSGEIYAGRCKVETVARLAVQYGQFKRGVHTYRVFDAPHTPGNLSDRLSQAAALVAGSPYAAPIELTVCESLDSLIDALQTVQGDGMGEGLMLHHPTAPWKAGRSWNHQKVKSLSALLAQAAILA